MFKWVIQQYKKILLFACVAFIVGVYALTQLSFNHDFEQYFPQESNSYEQYLQHYNTFQDKENWFFISPETRVDGIFDTSYQTSVEKYVEALQSMPGIEAVNNPLHLKLPLHTFFGWQSQSVFASAIPVQQLKAQIQHSPELYGTLVARDFSSVLIKVELKDHFPADSNQYLYESILKLGEKYDFKNIHMGGRFPAEQVYVQYLQSETILFTSLSALFILVILYFMYGSIHAVVVPFLAVMLSLLWTLMCMTFMGKSLDILTIMLPPILFVITISDLTHLYSRYLEEKQRAYTSNRQAMLLAISEVGPATFITAFTTAAGFISFLSSKIIPIKQFGIYACIGVFISYFIAYFIFPSLLVGSNVRLKKSTKALVQSYFWEHRLLPGLFKFSLRHYSKIVMVSVAMLILAIVGAMQLKVNAFILDDVPQKSRVKSDMIFLEKNFNGVRPLELSLTFKDSTIWDINNFNKAAQIQRLIEKNYAIHTIYSVVSATKSIYKGANNNQTAFYQLPNNNDTLQWCLNELYKVRKRKELKKIISADGKTVRFFTTLPDKGSAFYAACNKNLLADVQQLSLNNEVLLITGGSQLLDENTHSLTDDLKLDLIIGVLVISLLMAMLFKKIKMVIIALVPNLLPLLFTAGLMGLLGIDLKPSNALIFSIAFGIAVDDSIHFLARYKQESLLHRNLKAIYITYLSTGKAMIFTALVVMSGFVCLMFSNFQSIYYMGLLVSTTLFFAIFCDLLILPGLLFLVNKKQK
jgi:predicted RND superfamily exporter protein